jgi:hypothetical protein
MWRFLPIIVLLLGSTSSVWAESPKSDRPLLIVNYDNSNWFFHRTAEEMTRAKLIDFIDRHSELGITHLFLNTNAMRSNFASKTRKAIWDHDEKVLAALPPSIRTWPENSRLLHDRGLDPYAIWIERSREKGISPWISMRMNDTHDVNNPENFMHSQFWKNHPEFRCKVNGGLDFAHPEVRQHAISYVRELLDRYDPDGIELDWMRFPNHFKQGEQEKNGPVLTQFMRDVHAEVQKAAKRRGHPIQIAARTPVTPEIACKKAIDGVTWAREGLVDILVPSPFWNTADFDIPVESWQESLGPAADKVKILPGCEVRIQPYDVSKFVEFQGLETVRGFTAGALERDADGIYLFNFFDRGHPFGTTTESEILFAEFIRKLSRFEDLPKVRRRHVVTFVDTLPAGVKLKHPLPATLIPGEAATFKIHIGEATKTGRVLAIVEIKKGKNVALNLIAHLNETPIKLLEMTKAKTDAKNVRYVFSAPADLLKDGYNELKLGAGQKDSCDILWVELAIEPNQAVNEK